eukprot:1953587-Rhodomonas_salina.5
MSLNVTDLLRPLVPQMAGPPADAGLIESVSCSQVAAPLKASRFVVAKSVFGGQPRIREFLAEKELDFLPPPTRTIRYLAQYPVPGHPGPGTWVPWRYPGYTD